MAGAGASGLPSPGCRARVAERGLPSGGPAPDSAAASTAGFPAGDPRPPADPGDHRRVCPLPAVVPRRRSSDGGLERPGCPARVAQPGLPSAAPDSAAAPTAGIPAGDPRPPPDPVIIAEFPRFPPLFHGDDHRFGPAVAGQGSPGGERESGESGRGARVGGVPAGGAPAGGSHPGGSHPGAPSGGAQWRGPAGGVRVWSPSRGAQPGSPSRGSPSRGVTPGGPTRGASRGPSRGPSGGARAGVPAGGVPAGELGARDGRWCVVFLPPLEDPDGRPVHAVPATA